MKNAYPIKFTKQTFKIGDYITMWWTPARTQGKFVPRHRGLFKIIVILENSSYKLADKCEILKTPINRNLLKLYKSYKFMKLIVVID